MRALFNIQVALGIAFWLTLGMAHAQEPSAASSRVEPPKPLEQLEKSRQEMRHRLEKIVDDYLKKKEDEKKASGAQIKEVGLRIGSDPISPTDIDHYDYSKIATPNNDFTMHAGAWVQFDSVLQMQKRP